MGMYAPHVGEFVELPRHGIMGMVIGVTTSPHYPGRVGLTIETECEQRDPWTWYVAPSEWRFV